MSKDQQNGTNSDRVNGMSNGHKKETERVIISNEEEEEEERRRSELKKADRRRQSIWQTVHRKMSLGPKGATPLNWKLVFLVFISLVNFCHELSQHTYLMFKSNSFY